MTAVEASSADVELRARATGFVRARVRALGGRRVIEVDARGERNAGALVRSDGQSIAAGARAAREQRLPLLIRIASSGADAGEGVSALDGWAGAAKEITANSGVVPSIAIVSGPTVSGPALMLGLVDHVIMTSEAYAFVSGP
ncbi:MAG: carboxyl transferase domain-containing protein, partial [Acidimicrobiaceae bacterium]